MKNNYVRRIIYQGVGIAHDEEPVKTPKPENVPALMTDKRLKAELCEPAHNYKQCAICEVLRVCEYGKEAIRRSKG